MQQTPPPLKVTHTPPPHRSQSNEIVNRWRICAAVTLALIVLFASCVFLIQPQSPEILNEVVRFPETVAPKETVRTEDANVVKKVKGDEPPVRSGRSIEPPLNSDGQAETVNENSNEQNSRLERQVGAKLDEGEQQEFENDEGLSQYMPSPAEIANANRAIQLGGKVEFFGICDSGEHIAFLIDSSSSMSGERFERVKLELLDSLRKLQSSQKFSLYLFNQRAIYRPENINCSVSDAKIAAIERQLNSRRASGGTDPTEAIRLAVRGNCDVMFLLSDGRIPQTGQEIARLNRERKVINTVAVGGDSQSLRDVAKYNQGQYRNAH